MNNTTQYKLTNLLALDSFPPIQFLLEELNCSLANQDHEAVNIAYRNKNILEENFGLSACDEFLKAVDDFRFNKALLLIQRFQLLPEQK